MLADEPAPHTARLGCCRVGTTRLGAVMIDIEDIDSPGAVGRWNPWQTYTVPGTDDSAWTKVLE